MKVWVLLHDDSDAIMGIFSREEDAMYLMRQGYYSESLAVECWDVYDTAIDWQMDEVGVRLRNTD